MQKIFTIFLSLLVAGSMLSGCANGANDEKTSEDVETVKLYDSTIDYMDIMIKSAAYGDTDALSTAVLARNAKIQDLKLDYNLLTTTSFLNQYESFAGFSFGRDYLSDMVTCCLSGDIQGGLEAEEKRNNKIDTLHLDEQKISFEDLFLLSKIITAEAGSYWLPTEWKMMVGEVLLNRVASVEFPNTIEECIYQENQYYSRNDKHFANLLPYEDCVMIAIRLLSGERIINDGSVVFQANFPQGSGTYLKLYDEKLGYTYLCYSSYPELYE